VGDVVRCCIDIRDNKAIASYFKNGKFLGIAFKIKKDENSVFYPSI
jgi:hypothetical protein